MSHNKGKTLKNKMMYSKVLLGVSLVAFSVAIPVVQNKINSIRETRHNYELNVLIAQSQNDESIFYSEMLNTLTILNQKILPHSKNFNEALDEIRNRFLQRKTHQEIDKKIPLFMLVCAGIGIPAHLAISSSPLNILALRHYYKIILFDIRNPSSDSLFR